MTTADKKPTTAPEMSGADHTPLSEAFVLLDNSAGRDVSGKSTRSLFFRDPAEIVVAERPDEVAAALQRIEAGLAQGLHAAGFFSYELGYVLEPKLASLMPEARKVPLLWMGLYAAPAEMTTSEVAA